MSWTQEESRVESNRFDNAAGYYDQYRPSYPKEMIDKIVEYANLDQASNVLEVGAGSGKATELFVDRGYSITCIEQGIELSNLGMERFKSSGQVNYIVGRFENVHLDRESSDLLFSAQAFHWVEKPLGYALINLNLKKQGSAALMWNKYLDDGSDMMAEIKSICSKYGVLYMQNEEEIFTMCETDLKAIENTKYFEDIELFSLPWEEEKDLESFINFLSTGNGYLALSPDAKEALKKELEIVFLNYGNKMSQKFVCTTYLFKKR